MTITEFLLARIAEDEAEAHVFDGCRPTTYEVHGVESSPEYTTVYVSPDRLLAECKAKRVIINYHQYDHDNGLGYGTHICQDSLVRDDECDVLCALASVYADHPDYDPSWT